MSWVMYTSFPNILGHVSIPLSFPVFCLDPLPMFCVLYPHYLVSLGYVFTLHSVSVLPSWPVSCFIPPLMSLVLLTSSTHVLGPFSFSPLCPRSCFSLPFISIALPPPLPHPPSTYILGHVFLLPSCLWPCLPPPLHVLLCVYLPLSCSGFCLHPPLTFCVAPCH